MRGTGNVIRPFLAGLSLYSLFGLSVYFVMGKAEGHLWLNSFSHPWGDTFFRYFTETANGSVPVIAILILILVRYSWALALGVSAASMGIIVQWLKRGVFDIPRPAGFFGSGVLRSIEGLERASQFSFPSGHSATAFCLFLMFALLVRKRWATCLFLIWAILAAFSRVYISQHFIEDTIAGAWIGVGTTLAAYYFIVSYADRNPQSKLNRRLWP
ncbi:MAG: phosphatase PAP2 family protein [Flavobacteriales bacterium]|nr:phosphatase PAP2 family protein [Flavobacteriales bacterium]